MKQEYDLIRYGSKIMRKPFELALRSLVGTITHVATQDAAVALTFDDGPCPEFTPRLLDILEKYHARATFFMIGKSAEMYTELVRRIAQAGHAIGNHSWDHPSFPLITGRERREQILACEKVLAPYGQKIFRPPYGDQNILSRLDPFLLGYRVVTWNILAQDWLDHDAEWMANQLLDRIQPGSVILLHDALYHFLEERNIDRVDMLKTVDIILNQLHGRFRFVTVPELLQYGRPQRKIWYQKPNLDLLNKLRGRSEMIRHYV